jgi:uncharacterized protein YgiM (DUF1202 family)
MKKIFCLILTAMISIGLQAAEATHTNAAPATKKAASTTTKKTTPAPELRTEPLVAGPATVAVGRGPVNLRGKAGLGGEVIGRVTNGEPVVVIEEVTLKKSKPDEPSVWAKVALPPTVHAWVHTSYIDPATLTVKSKKLNLRGGPGENYSVVGTLEKGAVVKEVSRKGDWMEIETPSSAYAFMAARYLKQGPPETMITSTPTTTTTTPTEPAPTPTSISDTTTVAVATIDMAPTNNDTATALMHQPTVGLQQPDVETTPQPRIVQREGIVRGTLSIQAPTRYELISPDNRKPINYLYTTSPNLDLSSYKGLHIIVTGEEGLDERWKKTPIITIQRIQVLE